MRALRTVKGSTLLYLLDIVCMVFAVSLIAFTLYIIPYVLFGYEYYDVPEFVVQIAAWYETQHSLSGFVIVLAFLAPFVFAAVAFALISKLITYYLETHEYEPGVPHVDVEELETHKKAALPREAGALRGPTALIIGLIVLVLAVIAIAEYFVVISVF